MSSDVALAVVGKIVEKIVNPIVNSVARQFSYIFCYKKKIQTLGDQLSRLEARRDGVQLSIAEAERNLEIIDPTVKLWLTKVDDIKSKAIEVYEGTSNVKKGCLNGWCPSIKHRYLLSRKATKLTAGISKLKSEGDKDAKFSYSARPIGIISPVGISITPEDDGIKGIATRVENMNDVLDALKDDNINLIGISGMGGVGKTTLVKQVIEKVKAESLFNEFAMTVVSQQPDLVKIQGEIAGMLGLKLVDGSSDARAEQLSQRLRKSGRVLVVLDDIWEGANLAEVGIPIGNSCKVVFTTRMERACTEMASQRHIRVEVLCDQKAWSLFQEAAGDCLQNKDLQGIAKEVTKECGGLPIALVTLGWTLRERDMYEWKDTMLRLKKSSGMEEKVRSCIMLSYKFLESRLPNAQPLLLLCSLFEEDEDILIEQLVKYSMGLHLFDDVETLEETRNRVHTLVNYLKRSNLMLSGDQDSDLCVKLHDIVRDVCLLIASNPQHAYLVRHELKLKHWPQHNRLKVHTAIAVKSGALTELPGGLDYPNLRLLKLQLERDDVNIDRDFFLGMRGLQVFNFDGMVGRYRYKRRCNVLLPPTLELLTNLQTLSIEFCHIGGDLSSIACLKGLKILSFFESKLDEFPREVGELKNLRLLDLRCSISNSLTVEGSVLSQLYELEILYGGKYLFSSVKELNSLSCLTTLQISVYNSMILLELEKYFFDKLNRFDASIGCGDYSCGKYGIITNSIFQQDDELSWLSHTKLCSLVGKIRYFCVKGYQDKFNIKEMDLVLYNLEILEIEYCRNLTEIGVSNFYRLQELYIDCLRALKNLWRDPIQPPFLGSLRVLVISQCYSLTSLFPPNVAKCMVQLEDLQIRNCLVLKGVISNQGQEDDGEGFDNIQFPKLKSILLDSLNDFKSFYPEPGTEDLDIEWDTIRSLFNQRVSCPSLERIKIDHLDNLERVVGYQMHDGPFDNSQSWFMADNLSMFQNLKELDIVSCDLIEVVFDWETLKVGEDTSSFVFDKLASIDLYMLDNLAHIWWMVPDGIQGFRNLTTLKCVRCYKLRYLMPYSVGKMLVNLQSVNLSYCLDIVGIIEGENEECSNEAKSEECIVFPQLRVLVLDCLHSLTSFCSSKYSFEFPLLEEVKIDVCPNMKFFCSGEVKAPVLKEPFKSRNGKQWIWEGNVNNGYYRGKRRVWRRMYRYKKQGGTSKDPMMEKGESSTNDMFEGEDDYS